MHSAYKRVTTKRGHCVIRFVFVVYGNTWELSITGKVYVIQQRITMHLRALLLHAVQQLRNAFDVRKV